MLRDPFFALVPRSRSGFGAAIFEAVARTFRVLQLNLCRSRCNGCAKVARCHGCVLNTSFADGHRASHWCGCTKVAIVTYEQIVFHCGADDFPF